MHAAQSNPIYGPLVHGVPLSIASRLSSGVDSGAVMPLPAHFDLTLIRTIDPHPANRAGRISMRRAARPRQLSKPVQDIEAEATPK
jgi:hypothetical protein